MSDCNDIIAELPEKPALEHVLTEEAIDGLRIGIPMVHCVTVLVPVMPSLPWSANFMSQLANQILMFLIAVTLGSIAIIGQLFCMTAAKEIRAKYFLTVSLVISAVCLVLGIIACVSFRYASGDSGPYGLDYSWPFGLLWDPDFACLALMLLVPLNVIVFNHFIAEIEAFVQFERFMSDAKTAAKYWRISLILVVTGLLFIFAFRFWSWLVALGFGIMGFGFVFGMAAFVIHSWTLRGLKRVLRGEKEIESPLIKGFGKPLRPIE